MRKETTQKIEKLNEKIILEREELYNKIFVESHPNIVEGDNEHNIKELSRYQKFHEQGFDAQNAIEDLCVLDGIIEDLNHLIYFENLKKPL
jgi:hypothetical protein